MRYGMVIDLLRCVGCNSCTVACRAEQGTPANIHFNKIKKYEIGKYPSAKMKFLPMPCMHCQNPACLTVCPTGATYTDKNNLVLIDYEKCIGCRACILACPYESRQFLWDIGTYYSNNHPTPFEKHKQKKFQRGTVAKCNFCLHRIKENKLPACVDTCPAEARFFGDIEDPNSEVSKLITLYGGNQFRMELGTKPSVFYVRN